MINDEIIVEDKRSKVENTSQVEIKHVGILHYVVIFLDEKGFILNSVSCFTMRGATKYAKKMIRKIKKMQSEQ